MEQALKDPRLDGPPVTSRTGRIGMRHDLINLTSRFEDALARGGVTPVGIMWPNATDLAVRFETLLSTIDFAGYAPARPLRLLDLGCGPGFLLDWLSANQWLDRVDYTGVDVTDVTLKHARDRWPAHRFLLRDVREEPFAPETFDFAIICGVFIARFENSYAAMEALTHETLRAVWLSTRLGLSFNTASKHVDWERDDLFHWPLDDIMRFCTREMSRHVALHLNLGPRETAVVVTREPVRAKTATPPAWDPPR